MKDTKDNLTVDAFTRSRGRPQQYTDKAAKQRAYRARTKARTYTYNEITECTKRNTRYHMAEAAKQEDRDKREWHRTMASGLLLAWQLITTTRDDHDEAVLNEIVFPGLMDEIARYSNGDTLDNG